MMGEIHQAAGGDFTRREDQARTEPEEGVIGSARVCANEPFTAPSASCPPGMKLACGEILRQCRTVGKNSSFSGMVRIMTGKCAYAFLGVLEHERVTAEDGSDEDLEFHVREVLTNTCPVDVTSKRWVFSIRFWFPTSALRH